MRTTQNRPKRGALFYLLFVAFAATLCISAGGLR